MNTDTIQSPDYLGTHYIPYARHHKGPFKYYVIKKVGGWGWPNAYVCLQGGWVGVAKCLRNYKKFLKKTKLTSKKSCMGLQFLSLR